MLLLQNFWFTWCQRRNVIDRQLYAHHISLAVLAMGLTTRLASGDLFAAFSLEWRLHGMVFQSTDRGCRAVAYSALPPLVLGYLSTSLITLGILPACPLG